MTTPTKCPSCEEYDTVRLTEDIAYCTECGETEGLIFFEDEEEEEE